MRAPTLSPTDAFWQWFIANEQRLWSFHVGTVEAIDILNTLISEMRKVNPNLTFEMSTPDAAGKREFIISANGLQRAFPAVEALYAAAPSLDRWIWIKYRPRRDTILAVGVDDTQVNVADVRYLLFRDGDKVGILLFFKEYAASQRTLFGTIGFSFLDQILGEYAVATTVGFVDFLPFSADNFSQASPLTALGEQYDAFLASQHN